MPLRSIVEAEALSNITMSQTFQGTLYDALERQVIADDPINKFDGHVCSKNFSGPNICPAHTEPVRTSVAVHSSPVARPSAFRLVIKHAAQMRRPNFIKMRGVIVETLTL